MVKLGCHTGMRQGEFLGLAWGRVDSKEGFIRLNPADARTNEARLAPLSRALVIIFSDHDKGEEITY
jgi:integrase